MKATKSVWLSGEICEASGIYFSDICGHPIRKEFSANDIFGRCPTCHAAIRWMRFTTSAAFKAEKIFNPTGVCFGFSGGSPEQA